MNCCDFLYKFEQTAVLYCGATIDQISVCRLCFCANKMEFIVNSFRYYHHTFASFHALSLRSNNSFDYPSNSIFQMPSQFIFIFCNTQQLCVPVCNLAHDFTANRRRIADSDVFIEISALVSKVVFIEQKEKRRRNV